MTGSDPTPGDLATEALASVAFHEAGHAVADFLLGIRVDHVSIVEDETTLGRVRHRLLFRRRVDGEWDVRPGDRPRIENRIVAFLAGPIAEAKARDAEFDPGQAGADDDVRQVFDHGQLGRGLSDMRREEQAAYLGWLTVRAECLVEDNWYLIVAIAAALFQNGEMSGPAINKLLRATVKARADAVFPEAFEPTTIEVDGVTVPFHADPTRFKAVGWRLLAHQVAVISRQAPEAAEAELQPASESGATSPTS